MTKKGDGVTRKILRGLWAVVFVCVLSVPGGGDKAWGAFVKKSQADDVAMSWILKDSNPMKNGMGHKVREVLAYSGDAQGEGRSQLTCTATA